uniref:Uncharacterized protein n=1 Tax=Ditylum brightwellii TaxID=49249 RepID=A0A7S4R0D5_9STRA|mmetsp:Transcript_11253/g.16590  ORF Transcript_11253/g.16590 Transcript_11253/m.16590 type:complete len:269 (-) Transcript_11253:450-1256(-)
MDSISGSDTEAKEQSVTVASDREVRIVDHFNYTNVDDMRPPSFVEWWPVAAKTVIAGMYNSQDSQRAAIRALMPLFERFKRKTVVQPRMMSADALNVQEMLSSRLMFEEQYMRSVKDAWQESITMLEERCMRVFKANKAIEDAIDKKGVELERKYTSRISAKRVKEVLDSLKTTYKQRQRRDSALELKLLRSEAMQITATKRPETRQLDERIESSYRGASSAAMETLRRVRETYDAHISNIEHDMAQQLIFECKEKWMRGLSPPKGPN